MIVNLKERQPVNMMPGGVITTMGYARLIKALRETGEFSDNEVITHVSSDLTGLTFRIEHIR
jgi:hypothetical protein